MQENVSSYQQAAVKVDDAGMLYDGYLPPVESSVHKEQPLLWGRHGAACRELRVTTAKPL